MAVNNKKQKRSDFMAAYARHKSGAQNGGYPRIGESHGIAAVTVTVLIMAFSGFFGIYPILLLYALWLPQVLRKGQFILRPSRELMPAALFTGYSLLSVFWSDYRGMTMRAGLEFISMIACTIIMARAVSTRAFIKGVIAGSSLVLVITLADGTYGQDYFTGAYSLIGLFGSKNQVGLFAEVGLFAAFVYLFVKSHLPDKLLFSVLPALLCLACLYLSRSATSVASFGATLLAVYAIHILSKTSRRTRFIVFAGAGFLVFVMGAAALYAGFQDAFLHFFGKNSTLTGRTQLWAEGIASGLKAPFLGHGYSAFWVVGQPDAERYWYEFGIRGRSGFHFHNLLIQSFVDLGIAGLLLIAALILTNCIGSFRYTLKNGPSPKSIFCLGISLMFLIRTFVEVDFLGPFGIGALLFYYVLPHLAAESPAGEKRPQDIALPRARPALRGYRKRAYEKT